MRKAYDFEFLLLRLQSEKSFSLRWWVIENGMFEVEKKI